MNTFPPVDIIFNDLDKYRDYCRFEGKIFDEADLYNKNNERWQSYLSWQNWKKNPRRPTNKKFKRKTP